MRIAPRLGRRDRCRPANIVRLAQRVIAALSSNFEAMFEVDFRLHWGKKGPIATRQRCATTSPPKPGPSRRWR
jgi:glutamine synthetase adenylyltransferase